jgi:hypothetical protein
VSQTDGNGVAVDVDVPLPLLVRVTSGFSARLPSQRLLDMLLRIEPVGFKEIAETQPFRLVAFRALLRDFPNRDPTSLWLHAYDVEVEVEDVDPTGAPSATPSPPSAGTGGAYRPTSTS